MARGTAWDAIVVGSGITGGWAAKELCERGLRTLVLEAGRNIDPVKDAVEHVPSWRMRFRGMGDRRALERDRPVQKQCYACDEWAAGFFVNDRENPYTHPPDKPFAWIRGRQVGGRSLTWYRQVYRWSDLDFTANARDGVAVDWPIRYADLAPWYDHVERFIGVSGQVENLAQLPDSQFLPPMEMNCAERVVRDAMAGRWGRSRVLTIGRSAVLTQAHLGRSACHYCGPCHRGCVTRSYFSSVTATLPAAQATGHLTLRPHSVVHSVSYDPRTGRARGVRVIDAVSREALDFEARIVFLCASTLESTRLLLLSGLGTASGQLGKNLMDHTMARGATGIIPGMEHTGTRGQRPNGVYVPRFRNATEPHAGFLRGYAFQGDALAAGWRRPIPGAGADFKRQLLAEQGPWTMTLEGYGECLPRPDNFVELDPVVVDAWGIPALRIHCSYGPNEEAQMRDMPVTATEILDAAGATDIKPLQDPLMPGLVIHEMGTARMGRDPRSSVLDGWNRLHDVPNLFVTDGACMTSSGNQNPSLTYMALTARAAAHAADLLNRMEL
jgi:choline dehydrogenase-like flavoprotein